MTDTLAAAHAVSSSLPSPNGNWSAVSIIDQPGAQTYPLATFTYIMVYQDLGQAYGSALNLSSAQALASFLWYITHDGQNLSAGLYYAPLPEAVVASVCEPAVNDLRYDGVALSSHLATGPTFAVTFSEQGLAPRTPWSVQVNGYPQQLHDPLHLRH